MFNSIKHIPVDRKNSLPVSDMKTRYRATGTPVVFGDLTRYWPASQKWSREYVAGLARGNIVDAPLLRLPLFSFSELEHDFKYPRLGFHFYPRFTGVYLGREGAKTVMKQSSNVMHTVRCHFGEPISVLLVPPIMSPLMYRVSFTRRSVRDIDFEQPQFDKYPALSKVSGYVAELKHGDALYIPAGFWHYTVYHGEGVTLSLKSMSGNFASYLGALGKLMLRSAVRATPLDPLTGSGLSRRERRTVSATNARYQKFRKK